MYREHLKQDTIHLILIFFDAVHLGVVSVVQEDTVDGPLSSENTKLLRLSLLTNLNKPTALSLAVRPSRQQHHSIGLFVCASLLRRAPDRLIWFRLFGGAGGRRIGQKDCPDRAEATPFTFHHPQSFPSFFLNIQQGRHTFVNSPSHSFSN